MCSAIQVSASHWQWLAKDSGGEGVFKATDLDCRELQQTLPSFTKKSLPLRRTCFLSWAWPKPKATKHWVHETADTYFRPYTCIFWTYMWMFAFHAYQLLMLYFIYFSKNISIGISPSSEDSMSTMMTGGTGCPCLFSNDLNSCCNACVPSTNMWFCKQEFLSPNKVNMSKMITSNLPRLLQFLFFLMSGNQPHKNL